MVGFTPGWENIKLDWSILWIFDAKGCSVGCCWFLFFLTINISILEENYAFILTRIKAWKLKA
jgi:hypothetical protein